MNRFYVQDYGTCWDKYTVLEAVSKLSKCGDSVPGPLGGSYTLRPKPEVILPGLGTNSRIRHRLIELASSVGLTY